VTAGTNCGAVRLHHFSPVGLSRYPYLLQVELPGAARVPRPPPTSSGKMWMASPADGHCPVVVGSRAARRFAAAQRESHVPA